jgi:hypothetical protein
MISSKENWDFSKAREQLDKLEVLNEIYSDLKLRKYATKEEKDTAKLKMQLIKKEMLLLNYILNQEIQKISLG